MRHPASGNPRNCPVDPVAGVQLGEKLLDLSLHPLGLISQGRRFGEVRPLVHGLFINRC